MERYSHHDLRFAGLGSRLGRRLVACAQRSGAALSANAQGLGRRHAHCRQAVACSGIDSFWCTPGLGTASIWHADCCLHRRRAAADRWYGLTALGCGPALRFSCALCGGARFAHACCGAGAAHARGGCGGSQWRGGCSQLGRRAHGDGEQFSLLREQLARYDAARTTVFAGGQLITSGAEHFLHTARGAAHGANAGRGARGGPADSQPELECAAAGCELDCTAYFCKHGGADAADGGDCICACIGRCKRAYRLVCERGDG